MALTALGLGDPPEATRQFAFFEGVDLAQLPPLGENVDKGRSEKWTAKPPCL